MLLRSILAILILLTILTSAQAVTLMVQLDGSGDYDSIAGAIDAAQPGDSILVGPGIYSEHLFITKSLTLESEFGREFTTLDGADAFQIMEISGPWTVTVRGFLFTNANSQNGSALFIWNGPTVVVEDCSFVENYAFESNAVHARHEATSTIFRRCEFLRNSCAVHSAALGVGFGGSVGVYDCVFAENTSYGTSAAVNTLGARAEFEGNLFLSNSGSGAGALKIESGDLCSVT